MNKDLVDISVSEALWTLRKKYPNQRVTIRVMLEPGKPTLFLAGVEHVNSPHDYQCNNGDSAHEAVERLIAEVGDHNQLDYTQIKINQLEDEIAKLKRTLPHLVQPMGDNEPANPSEGYGHHQTIR